MHWLHPAGLFGLGLDAVFANRVEQRLRAIAQHDHEARPDIAMARFDVVGVGARQRRDDLAIVAPRGAPAGHRGLDDGHLDAGLAKLQRGRQPGEAGADDQRIDIQVSVERRAGRPRLRHGGPQGADFGGGHGSGHPVSSGFLLAAPRSAQSHSVVPIAILGRPLVPLPTTAR